MLLFNIFATFLRCCCNIENVTMIPICNLNTTDYTTVVNNIAARLLRADIDYWVIADFTLITIISIIFRKFTSWKLSNEFHILKSGVFTCSFEFRGTTRLSLSVRENVVNIIDVLTNNVLSYVLNFKTAKINSAIC